MNALSAAFVLMICITGVMVMTNDDENQHQLYCDMAALYEESNGEYGWPTKFVESKGYDCKDSK